MNSVTRNGITVIVEKWPKKKLPVLAVKFSGEPYLYKVASFDSDKDAHWFLEIMEEFFKNTEETTKEEQK
jgi:hypothetical protein